MKLYLSFFLRIKRAFLCDARERDLSELEVNEDGMAMTPLDAGIISVRIILSAGCSSAMMSN